MTTELSHDRTLLGQIDRELERSFSKAFFIRQFLQGDTARAGRMGVAYGARDRKLALLAAGRIFSQVRLYDALARAPGIRDMADRRLVRKLEGLLARYGRADFTSDGETYRPAHG